MSVEGNVSSDIHLLEEKPAEASNFIQPPAHVDYRLKAVIIHLGKSVHSGHYVAYVRHGDDWVLFNDEKVTKSLHPVLGKGYVYLYEGM
jgi:uncharacterized UBP type Zn finger protein